jgi:hypothetical protein
MGQLFSCWRQESTGSGGQAVQVCHPSLLCTAALVRQIGLA